MIGEWFLFYLVFLYPFVEMDLPLDVLIAINEAFDFLKCNALQ